MPYYLDPKNRGYLLTEAGQERLAQGGMKGAYLDSNGRVAIPGKRTTLYSPPAPTKEEAELEQVRFDCVSTFRSHYHISFVDVKE